MAEVTVTRQDENSAVLLEVGEDECMLIPYDDVANTIRALFGVYVWLDPAGARRLIKGPSR